LEKGSIN